MMLATKKRYDDFAYRRVEPEARFDGGLPEWPLIDRLGQSWVMRVAWGAAYVLFYLRFATRAVDVRAPAAALRDGADPRRHRQLVRPPLRLPELRQRRRVAQHAGRSTSLTSGELFQNNHHKFGMSPNFAVRWFEIDPPTR